MKEYFMTDLLPDFSDMPALSDTDGDFLSDGSESFSANTGPFDKLENFEAFLTKRTAREEPYGLFDKDASVCQFFGGRKNEKLLADILAKNEAEGMGNAQIPNTNITLINYSVCPKCATVFSFKDLGRYYANPRIDPQFKSRSAQFRQDTRVCCSECAAYFLPALIISDGTPRNEVQFLCRIQTSDAIEKFFINQGTRVLTRRSDNKVQKSHLWAVRNDIVLRELESKPSLINNLLQYTPPPQMLNLIDGSNVRKGDVLFGTWKPE
jgi:hypothetical protein